MDHTDRTKPRLHIHLTERIEMELVLPESTKKNQLQTYKLLYNGEGQDGRRFFTRSSPLILPLFTPYS